MARRKDHTREELRELSIEGGRRLVEEKGPEALTARNVAQAIGYTPGTLYNLFANIEELATAINTETLNRFGKTVGEILNRAGEARERVEEICHAYLELQRKEKNLWMLLFATPQKEVLPEFSAAVHEVFDQVTEAILPLSGSEEKARMDAKIIWSTLHGICLLQENKKLDVTEADTAEKLVCRFLGHIFPSR